MSHLVFKNFDEEEDNDKSPSLVPSQLDHHAEDYIPIPASSDNSSLTVPLEADTVASNGGFSDDENSNFPDDFAEEPEDLPEYACAYCGIHSVNSVVKCNSCNKWFCNSSSHEAGSHIVTHLVLSKHNQVSLHEESDLGDTTLECYNCGNKNVFILGFVSAKEESVVIILCRLPCAQKKDINWDVNNWQSLIEERQFLPWVAAVPQEEELINAKMITTDQIRKLESQWKLNRNATIEDINKDKNDEEKVLPILMRYSDAFQYQSAFAPLVQLEADYDMNLKESQALEHIQVKWAIGLNSRHLASFTLSTYESTELKIAVGDEIILRYSGSDHEPWEGTGFIIRLPSSRQEEFTLELKPEKIHPPVHLTSDFTAEFVWKGVSYDLMQRALKLFAVDEESVSAYIYHKLLGHEVAPIEFSTKIPERLSHPKLAELNISQTNAVRAVLQRPLSLIQGPPGTGKTVTSATIVYHLSKLHKKKILVCAPSNVAVDHLAEKLHLLGLSVVRIVAKLREDVESSASNLALHNILNKRAKGELKSLIKLKNELGELSAADAKIYTRLYRAKEAKILAKCDVVCCTCVGAGSYKLANIPFRTVLIDESTQASEPEVLIPIVKGAKQVILVGDHQQLGPVIVDKRAAEAGLKQSLFERLVLLGHVPIRLEVQYRMHPALSEFPSNMFYEGSLQNGVTSEQRTMKNSTFPWPVYDTPMMFWANYGREEISGSGISYLNRVEAMNVEKIVTKLFKDGVKPDQIGVITPYEGQRAFIINYLSLNSTLIDKRQEYLEIEVTSVDAFQGREKDYIILSCVRANEAQNIGFLRDPRRLNVALTRAKYGLAILGNPRSLSKNTLWNHVLIHFRERGCLVEGPLDNLQLSMVPLNTPRGLPLGENNRSESNGYGSKSHKGLGYASSTEFGSSTDFDTASILSYADSYATKGKGNKFRGEGGMKDSEWPALSSVNNEYSEGHHNLNSNFLTKLKELGSQNQSSYKIDDDIRSITSSFASGLNLG